MQVVGAILLVYGVGSIYVPAGVILAGLMLAGYGVLKEYADAGTDDPTDEASG